jgi:predicted metal-dependent peptidase
MVEAKDKDERKLKKVKIALMRNPKFVHLSGVMMVGKTKIEDNIPTAYTNGRDEGYGREMIKWMSEKELGFVILHENLHKAYRHLYTWRKLYEIDKRLANMACDYVINLQLVDADPDEVHIAMPKKDGKLFGLLDKRFAGMDTKQVFDILRKEKKEGGDQGDGEGFDEHGWDDAQELTEQEQKDLVKEIDRALRQGQIAASKVGKGTGGMDRAIGELLRPEVDWKSALRDFVTSTCSGRDTSSWRRPNRRFIGHDIYMPSLMSERVGRMVVGVDTSGSIGGRILDRFLSEVKSLADEMKPEGVDLLYWDSEVSGHEVYDSVNLSGLLDSTKPKGGGGTRPSCVPSYMKDKQLKPECVVMLTDGEINGDWGQYDVPVLWVVVGSNNVSPVGKTVNVKEI